MTLFFNAKFVTMKNDKDIAKAILVDDKGVIAKVYYETPSQFNGNRVDLHNAFVCPGFVDTHTHSFEGGLYSFAGNLGGVKSIAETLELLSLAETIEDKIVAYNYDENEIKEKRFPTIKELDSISRNKAVLVRRIDGHSAVINSKALESMQLPVSSDFNGYITKELNNQVFYWFHKNISEDWILKAYHKAAEIAVKNGHTAIHTMIGDAVSDPLHYNLLRENSSQFPIDFIPYPQVMDVEIAVKLGSPRIGGCVLADGSFGSRTAALSQAYLDDKNNYGVLYKSDEEWRNYISQAHDNNLQVCIHCIGDRAIKQIVDLYAEVQKKTRKSIRHQIIHSELISEDKIIEQMAEYDIAAVMQPLFDKKWGGENGFYAEVLGKERALNCNRFKSLTQAGVLVTGGSDWYVVEMNALAGINAAVNTHNPLERLTPYQALSLYTCNPALLIGKENEYGMLQEGYVADFSLIDTDLLVSDDIASAKVKAVYKQGRQIF